MLDLVVRFYRSLLCPSLSPEARLNCVRSNSRPLPAQPLVSILVSNYNYARFIGDSIQSALEQTYSNIELIICDDGSTDDSVRIIEEYARKDSRLHLIRKDEWRTGLGLQCCFCRQPGRDYRPA